MKLAQQTQARNAVPIIIIFFFVFGVSTSMAGLFEKPTLDSPWKELFADVAKLNEHQQQGHLVELRNVRVENYNLAGAHFDKAKFEDTDWKGVTAKGATFSNTTFRNCKLDQVRFEEATLKDVTFDHCEFSKVSFFHAQLPGVRFIDCTLKDKTTFQASTNGNITFENATMNDVKFYKAQAVITVKDSKITDGDFTTMQAPSALTFEKSELKEVIADGSILRSLVLNDVKSSKSGIRNGRVGKIEIDGGEVAFGLSESSIEVITVRGARINALSMDDVKLSELSLSDCSSTKNIGLYQAAVKIMKIERCPLNDFRPRSAVIEQWILKDSSLSNSKFEGMRAKEVTFENVTLGGTLNFTDANIERLNSKNVTKQGGLEFIDARSNVKFD